MPEPEIVIRLTLDEAAVLGEFLRRYSDTDLLAIEDQAEQQALWNLQCLFEKLPDRNFPSLDRARAALRGEL